MASIQAKAFEASSIDDHIMAYIIYPHGVTLAKQLPFIDQDGDDTRLVSFIKEKLFEVVPKNYLSQDYDLVFVKVNQPSIIAEEEKSVLDYLDLLKNNYKIQFVNKKSS